MFVSKTRDMLVVRVDQNNGSYICLPKHIDAEAFESFLKCPPCTLFLKESNRELTAKGEIYYFGTIVDPVKVQELVDKIPLKKKSFWNRWWRL